MPTAEPLRMETLLGLGSSRQCPGSAGKADVRSFCTERPGVDDLVDELKDALGPAVRDEEIAL